MDRLRTWCSETSAEADGDQHSLDFRLRDSGGPGSNIVQLLDVIQCQLENAISHPAGLDSGPVEDPPNPSEFESDNDSECERAEAEMDARITAYPFLKEIFSRPSPIFSRAASLPSWESSTPMQNYYREITKMVGCLHTMIPVCRDPLGTDYLVCYSDKNKYVRRFKDVDRQYVAAKFPLHPLV